MTDPIAQALAIAPVSWTDETQCEILRRKTLSYDPAEKEWFIKYGPDGRFQYTRTDYEAHALFVAGQMQRLVSKGWKVELTAFAVGGWRARIDICECEAPTPALALAELVCKIGESK